MIRSAGQFSSTRFARHSNWATLVLKEKVKLDHYVFYFAEAAIGLAFAFHHYSVRWPGASGTKLSHEDVGSFYQ